MLPAELLDENTKYFINPTGRFVVGGPQGDSGLTGRKIIVDTYGGYAQPRRRRVLRQGPQQGGPHRRLRHAPRGQEPRRRRPVPTRCEVGVAYAIGVAKPVSVFVDTEGTGVLPDDKLAKIVEKMLRSAPRGHHPPTSTSSARSTQQVAAYGHFGRDDLDLPWEHLDKVELLKETAKNL